jgi:hypothetical protein
MCFMNIEEKMFVDFSLILARHDMGNGMERKNVKQKTKKKTFYFNHFSFSRYSNACLKQKKKL